MSGSDRPRSWRSPVARAGPWIPLTVLLLGLVSLLMLLGANQISERLIEPDRERHGALLETETALATAHLWLEEHLTGDRVDTTRIASSLDRAAGLIGGLLGEARDSPIGPRVAPLRDPELRELAASVRDRLESFRAMSSRRLEFHLEGREVGVGSSMDAEYDGLFGLLFAETRELRERLEIRRDRNRARARSLLVVIAFSWIAIVGLSSGALWSRGRRRWRVEAALRDREAQLHRARKLDAIGRLAGGMAHDIGNHLGAIQAHAELTRSKCSDDATAQRIDAILSSVSKASTLVDRLLAIGRRQPVKPVVLDVNTLVRSGVESELETLIAAGITVERRLPPDLWRVEIDPSQALQLILNLLVNAREAMPSGGRLEIETSNVRVSDEAPHGTVRPGDYVVLAVSDTGSGIPPDVQDRIFEPFFTSKDGARNTGLGLATVQAVVEQAGGTIAVETDAGRGATFRVYLPRSSQPMAG